MFLGVLVATTFKSWIIIQIDHYPPAKAGGY